MKKKIYTKYSKPLEDIIKFDKNFNIKKIIRKERNLLLEHGAGIMFRSKFLKKIGGYDQKIRNCEDFDLINE